jgi:hypothetical protein
MQLDITYQNDLSFFTYITVLDVSDFCPSIVRWFEKEPNAQFRIVVDKEADSDFISYSSMQELYPGIRVIATVTNPWRRLVNIYEVLKQLNQERRLLETIKDIDFSNFTFESFLTQLDTNIYKWFNFSTLQSKWIDESNDFLYIVRDDFFEEDFKVLREYFKSDLPVDFKLTSYKEYYTEETKKFVEDLFKSDIERFQFKY